MSDDDIFITQNVFSVSTPAAAAAAVYFDVDEFGSTEISYSELVATCEVTELQQQPSGSREMYAPAVSDISDSELVASCSIVEAEFQTQTQAASTKRFAEPISDQDVQKKSRKRYGEIMILILLLTWRQNRHNYNSHHYLHYL